MRGARVAGECEDGNQRGAIAWTNIDEGRNLTRGWFEASTGSLLRG